MSLVQFLQLPLHPGTAWEPTGNILLAPASMAAAAGLPPESVFPGCLLDTLGDTALLEELQRRQPEIIAVTLYLWNRDRTINLLRNYRKLNPGIMVVAGGPEVTPDNSALVGDEAIDLFVAGEGEPHAGLIFRKDFLRQMISSGERILGPVLETSSPDRWPDPYETGHAVPAQGGAAHIETQRGCRCLCSYCAYRRTSPVPRVVPAEKALRKIRKIKELGASELVFLDPTFNARIDLEQLLNGMNHLELDCFAEVRGDLLDAKDAVNMKKAGFHSLEVGLQTMSAEVLKSVGRGGNPERILQGAEFLRDSGITPVMDLILGLPGDNTENIERAAEAMVERNISQQVQTFCLSVLPGTELRANAENLGIKYLNRPPYCVSLSGENTLPDLLRSRDRISDILGYDADPPPRPVLCDGFPGMETYIPEKSQADTPSSIRHGVLRILSGDPWRNRKLIMDRIALRRERDPFCPLDVVIESDRAFPLDLLDMISSLPEPQCYDLEKARIYGVQSLLRTAVIAGSHANPAWLSECSKQSVTVVRSEHPRALPGGLVGLLLEGHHDLQSLSALYSQALHLVFFRNFDLERLWNLEILGLG